MKATVRKEFIDKYTNELHKIGEVLEVSEERISEIRKVDEYLIEVVEGDTIPTKEDVSEEKVDAPEPPKKSGRKGRKKGEQ